MLPFRIHSVLLLLATGLMLAAPTVAPRCESSKDIQGAVLIILDTVRADRLSSYGHERATSPFIDGLARDGVLFENVISTAPWTLPSLASMLSGRWVDRSMEPHLEGSRIRDSLIQAFARSGLKTAAFTEGGFMSRHYGFDEGFQTYQEEEGPVQLTVDGQRNSASSGASIHSTFKAAREWLGAIKSEPFFLLIHTYEPHTPYRRHHFTKGLNRGRIGDSLEIDSLDGIRKQHFIPNQEEIEYVHALYDSGLKESDNEVGRLLAELEATGLRDRTVIVVTSDHGEELGDHYPRELGNHGHSLRDDMLRVPLIISHPGQSFPVRRVSETVRTIDIIPTLAEMLRVPIARKIDGRSLVLYMLGADTRNRVAFGGIVDHGPQRSFVRTAGFKYIEVVGKGRSRLHPKPAKIQLYNLDEDPLEQNNIASREPELVARFAKMLRDHEGERRGASPDNEIPTQLKERLKSLGYLH